MNTSVPYRYPDVDPTEVIPRQTDPHQPSHRAAATGRSRWRISPDQLLAGIGLGAAVVAYWPIVVSLAGPQPLQLMPLVAHLCGMLAGFGVLVMVGLMSRAPALESGVGADVLARWHARGGRSSSV